jgi:general secretion pathway protein G
MNMKTNNNIRTLRAFTLIEMLAVILILAILAALIIPNVLSKAAEAKVDAAKTDIATLKEALQRYHLDNDTFPTTEQGLAALETQPSDAPNWKGPYLSSAIPNDPWQNPYQYTSPGPNNEPFFIQSNGPPNANAPITSDDTSSN